MIYDCCVRQKKCRSILKHVLKRCDNRKSCRRPVVMLVACDKIVSCKSALKEMYNVLLIDNWRFSFLSFKFIFDLVACIKTGCTSVFIFRLRSLSCSRSLFADL